MSELDDICLEIDNTIIPCKKKELIENSDYFKAMFEGSFAESHESTIKLKDVDLVSINIILTQLRDDTYTVNDVDILLVLQTACMLQFQKVSTICVERLTEIMSPENCIKIWYMTEPLDLKPLYLKAKSMALMEFPLIKDMDCLRELNLKQLCLYVSNVKLNCLNEMDVFDVCMKWWYENFIKESSLVKNFDKTNVLMSFLLCLDFNSMLDSDIIDMVTYRDISNNIEIVEILTNIIEIRSNVINNAGTEVFFKAKKLLRCKSRLNYNFPCLIIYCQRYPPMHAKMSTNSLKYFTKESALESLEKNVVLYNDQKGSFTKLFSIPLVKVADLKGYHVLGYKEYVFLFGGEVMLGSGVWNIDFWIYDTIRDRWEKRKMPYGRRHFESCIAGDILYIVGGTGSFRVIQFNMLWYSHKKNQWSGEITLPCDGRQIKCCDFNGQLLLLNVNYKCGYLFDLQSSKWIKMDISDKKKIVNSFPEKFVIFPYNGSLFIKGSSIIEIKVIDLKLEIVNCKYLKSIQCNDIESVICGDFLYTIYKERNDEEIPHLLLLEKFCMKTFTSEDVDFDTMASLEKLSGRPTQETKLFSFNHYSEFQEDTFIADFDFQ